jgi:hypothetical protein
MDTEILDWSIVGLDSILPKLARRLSQKTKVENTSSDVTPKSNNNIKSVQNPAFSSQTPAKAMGRRNTRKSVRGSICYTTSEFPEELNTLREQDIQHDPDSAAQRALDAISALAQQQPPPSSLSSPSPSKGTSGMEETTNSNHSPTQNNNNNNSNNNNNVATPIGPKVEGREIQQDHAQYALTYGMMLGIRVTTGRRDIQQLSQSTRSSSFSATNNIPFNNNNKSSSNKSSSTTFPSALIQEEIEREIQPEDFLTTTKLQFVPEGAGPPLNPFHTPHHKLPFTFTFKDYQPEIYRALRALANIEVAEYMTSLAGDFNYIEFLANSKSGQFFFYSHDGRFMIKTQSREEARLLRDMMPQYLQHLFDHRDSLVTRFFGLHRVQMPTLKRQTFFVVMSSVFYCPLIRPVILHEKYDLKGSTIGRRTPDEECRVGAVQKDLNFVENQRYLRLGNELGNRFIQTLQADTSFLRKNNIMDYSILIGIHDPLLQRQLPQRRQSGGVILAKVITMYFIILIYIYY